MGRRQSNIQKRRYNKEGYGAGMKQVSIIERFIKGKTKDEDLCEDGLFVGDRFIAVIDGVTAKTKTTYEGKTTGRYASEVLQKELARIEQEERVESTKPEQILSLLDQALKMSVGSTRPIPLPDYPRAAIIFCDLCRQVVVSYGDCKCKIGDFVADHEKKIDVDLSEKRSKVLLECLWKGESVEALRTDDMGRKAILQDLLEQFNHENKSGDIYGYPVLNGCGINRDMIQVYDLPCDTPVILCSDGYPVQKNTLLESEEVLDSILEEDPLLIGKNPFGYRATKAYKEGADSFDDRAWIKFIVTDEKSCI